MNDSAYVSLNPVYTTNGTAKKTPYRSPLDPAPASMLASGNVRAIPPTDENPPVTKKGGSSGTLRAFKNNIYDNVKIDIPLPDANLPEFCQIDDPKNKDDLTDKNGTGASPEKGKSLKEEVKDLFSGIPPKWLWAGGITAGLLILRGSKNK